MFFKARMRRCRCSVAARLRPGFFLNPLNLTLSLNLALTLNLTLSLNLALSLNVTLALNQAALPPWTAARSRARLRLVCGSVAPRQRPDFFNPVNLAQPP